MATVLALALLIPFQGSAALIAISQVYGGGGNSGATLTNDFVELYNPGPGALDLTGWTLQYASSTGSSWQSTPLAGSIAAYSYYLVQERKEPETTPLPTPDAAGTIPMSATAGKVALVSGAAVLSGTCPSSASIVDFVGYGAANCFEGSGATPTLSNTLAALRLSGGMVDTDNNSADFFTGAPDPRNSDSEANAPHPGAGHRGPGRVGTRDPCRGPVSHALQGSRVMIQLAAELRAEVERAAGRFRNLSEADVSRDRGAGRWLMKEMLGHLIDSAANNHQRFVRAQFTNPFVWPGYDQADLGAPAPLRERPWTELVNLWLALNLHVAAVIEHVPTEKLQTPCTIGDHEPASLEWWMHDYLRHLRHHLEQFELG